MVLKKAEAIEEMNRHAKEAGLADMGLNDLMANRFERMSHRGEALRFSRLDSAHGGIVMFCDFNTEKYGPHYRTMYLDDFRRIAQKGCLTCGTGKEAEREFNKWSALYEMASRICSIRADMLGLSA